ncbi:hypothetical protein FOZ61_010972, partial [Perkinsus olseni]
MGTRPECLHVASLDNGRNEGTDQLVLPRKVVVEVAAAVHDALGHAGYPTVFRNTVKWCWCPAIRRAVKHAVVSCRECLHTITKRSNITGEAGPIPIPRYPYEIVGVDLYGPLRRPHERRQREEKERYCLTIMDRLTGFVKFKLLDDSRGETVANAIEEYLIWELQAPVKEIWSDQGVQFTKGPNFHAVCLLGNMRHIRQYFVLPNVQLTLAQATRLGHLLTLSYTGDHRAWENLRPKALPDDPIHSEMAVLEANKRAHHRMDLLALFEEEWLQRRQQSFVTMGKKDNKHKVKTLQIGDQVVWLRDRAKKLSTNTVNDEIYKVIGNVGNQSNLYKIEDTDESEANSEAEDEDSQERPTDDNIQDDGDNATQQTQDDTDNNKISDENESQHK